MLKIFKIWYGSLSDGDKFFLGMIFLSIITGFFVTTMDKNYRVDYILNVSNANYYPSVNDEYVKNPDKKLDRLIAGKDTQGAETQTSMDEYGF